MVRPAVQPGAAEPADGADVFAPGELVGGLYEIREQLGAGGMGQVFEAHDRGLNRRVAIKVAHEHIPPDLLRREAQALAAVRHPTMVTVHSIGTHRGLEFIVMERIYGVSLEAHIEKRRSASEAFTIEEAVDILMAIADGLAAVHRSGISHRDIKPSNVMLAPGNRVVLMDFGLVLPEFEVASQQHAAGSPLYMAPEAFANTVEAGAGHLVDLYALGVMAYEMLTGEVPYDGKHLAEVWDKHTTAPVPDLGNRRPDAPPALAALVRALMAKEPRARPQSAEGVLFQLRQSRARVEPPATVPGFSVLIVDDDPDVTKVLGFYVKKAIPEAEVRTASDGVHALEAVRRAAPDVMLLDLHMPNMNGIEVAMYLRGTRLADGCTIVSVSASAQQHDVQLLQQLGITHFVAKGQKLGERLSAVLKTIRGRR